MIRTWLVPTILLSMMAMGTHALADGPHPIIDPTKLHRIYEYTMTHGKGTLDHPRTTDRLRNAFMGKDADHQMAMPLVPQYAGPCVDPIFEADTDTKDGAFRHLWLMITCKLPMQDNGHVVEVREHIFLGIRVAGPYTYKGLLSEDGTIMLFGIFLYPAGSDDPNRETRKTDQVNFLRIIHDVLEAVVVPET